MQNSCKTAVCTIVLSLIASAHANAAESASIDFSCMKEQVRPIIQVTDQHQEFDVVVRNQCPGNVYWAMCIERMDPWRHKVLESHTPGGYVEAEKRARVNLQMKATANSAGDRNRAQEFYLNIAYSIDEMPTANCVASACEARKTQLRAEAAQNEKAWQKARATLDDRLVSECPDNGWNTDDTAACRKAVTASMAEEMSAYEQTDAETRERLAAIDPESCTVYGGGELKLKKS